MEECGETSSSDNSEQRPLPFELILEDKNHLEYLDAVLFNLGASWLMDAVIEEVLLSRHDEAEEGSETAVLVEKIFGVRDNLLQTLDKFDLLSTEDRELVESFFEDHSPDDANWKEERGKLSMAQKKGVNYQRKLARLKRNSRDLFEKAAARVQKEGEAKVTVDRRNPLLDEAFERLEFLDIDAFIKVHRIAKSKLITKILGEQQINRRDDIIGAAYQLQDIKLEDDGSFDEFYEQQRQAAPLTDEEMRVFCKWLCKRDESHPNFEKLISGFEEAFPKGIVKILPEKFRSDLHRDIYRLLFTLEFLVNDEEELNREGEILDEEMMEGESEKDDELSGIPSFILQRAPWLSDAPRICRELEAMSEKNLTATTFLLQVRGIIDRIAKAHEKTLEMFTPNSEEDLKLLEGGEPLTRKDRREIKAWYQDFVKRKGDWGDPHPKGAFEATIKDCGRAGENFSPVAPRRLTPELKEMYENKFMNPMLIVISRAIFSNAETHISAGPGAERDMFIKSSVPWLQEGVSEWLAAATEGCPELEERVALYNSLRQQVLSLSDQLLILRFKYHTETEKLLGGSWDDVQREEIRDWMWKIAAGEEKVCDGQLDIDLGQALFEVDQGMREEMVPPSLLTPEQKNYVAIQILNRCTQIRSKQVFFALREEVYKRGLNADKPLLDSREQAMKMLAHTCEFVGEKAAEFVKSAQAGFFAEIKNDCILYRETRELIIQLAVRCCELANFISGTPDPSEEERIRNKDPKRKQEIIDWCMKAIKGGVVILGIDIFVKHDFDEYPFDDGFVEKAKHPDQMIDDQEQFIAITLNNLLLVKILDDLYLKIRVKVNGRSDMQ